MRYEMLNSHYMHKFSYPEEIPEFAGTIFFISKGTNLSRMDDHVRKAA